MPLEVSPIDIQSTTYQTLDSNRSVIENMLTSMGVSYMNYQFVYRTIPNEPVRNENLFVYIKATWDLSSKSTWPKCATALQEKLQINITLPIGVEIIAPELYQPKYMTVVEKAHPFIEVWGRDIRDQVYARLVSNPCLIAINVLRLGYERNHQRNPITILVTIDHSVNPSEWAGDCLAVENIVTEAKRRFENSQIAQTEIVVLFEHGEFHHLTKSTDAIGDAEIIDSENVKFTKHPYEIRLGSSIGFSEKLSNGVDCEAGLGTIGPILKISSAEKQLGVFALTNYYTRSSNAQLRAAKSPAISVITKSKQVLDKQISDQKRAIANPNASQSRKTLLQKNLNLMIQEHSHLQAIAQQPSFGSVYLESTSKTILVELGNRSKGRVVNNQVYTKIATKGPQNLLYKFRND